MCFRGCRGEGDEGDGTDDGPAGWRERGCCCDDLERYQRVVRESERKERKRKDERKGSGGEERRSAGWGAEGVGGESEGCGCRDVSVEMRREE